MTEARAPVLIPHDHGITAVDAEYGWLGQSAAHVVVRDGRALVVDSGTAHAVPRLLAALERLGVAREAVDYLFVTHVHLDHAGGAGALLARLPRARAVLHPRGAPHLIDPAKLIAGTKAVYGEAAYARLYGEILPLPAERIVITQDGDRLTLGASSFEIWHTPGHALHHHVLVDPAARAIFSGDTFGVSYREFDTARGAWVLATCTPTQFDPEQLRASIRRIVAWRPAAVYLMHYSRVGNAEALAAEQLAQIDAFVAMAERHRTDPARHAALRAAMLELWRARLRAHGCRLDDARIDELLELDLELNVQGLEAWLERRR